MQVVLILKFEFTAAFMTPGGSVFATIDVSPLRKKDLNCRMTFRYDIDRRRSIKKISRWKGVGYVVLRDNC